MTIVNRTRHALLSLVAASALAACGGGGDGGGAATPFPVQGGWEGSATSGEVVQAIVLEDGALWAISGPSSGSSFYPTDLFQGTLQATGGTLSSSNLRGYDFNTNGAISGTIAGSYVAGTSMTLTATPAGSSTGIGVNVTAALTANYDYNQPALLAAIAGSWPGFFSSSESGTVAVQSNGNFSTTTSLGCQVTGTATPRASGKNVFNVSLTFGAAPCNLPGGTGSGIAVVTRSGTTSQLAVAVTTPDRAFGGAFFGRR